MAFLYEKLATLREYGGVKKLPDYIVSNLNPRLELRPYQQEAFENFITHFESDKRAMPTQLLFHMATGSGKTLMMAGLMLYLYRQGYRNFLFFVNLANIVEKTQENFLNAVSSKYLFADEIVIDGERIRINRVDNFQQTDASSINICFTTTQGLHMDIWQAKENSMTLDDFENERVVLISDEAHHLNVDTKKLNKTEEENKRTWEQTVHNILEQNRENVLLEFTATCDLSNPAIKAAYQNKIVFDYPLKKFYKDRYSKDILTFRSELPVMERALQAMVLSQYRLKLFQSRKLAIKPVILFKAAKISDSKAFMAEFQATVRELDGERLEKLAAVATDGIMQRAFSYFQENNIALADLAVELKDDFSEIHCVSVNEDKDVEQRQILLNSLEDATNPYRAIFEVKKLDEGWDVLNLFDIVRLYETRQSGGKKISPATIAEAQLIGRGARYCPFKLAAEDSRFQRKFDGDTENEMRVCETLYYHCQNDHRYVTELRQALTEIGLGADNVTKRHYVLKEDFKKDDIYKRGYVFINDRVKKSRNTVNELLPSIRTAFYRFSDIGGNVGTDAMLQEKDVSKEFKVSKTTVDKTIADIAAVNYAIVNKALMQFPVYKFCNLKEKFPNLKSTREFITSADYLGSVKISITSVQVEPTIETLYRAVCYTVGKIAEAIQNIKDNYCGTKEFTAIELNKVFRDKTVNYTEIHEGGLGYSQNDATVNAEWKMDLTQAEWFAYADNYGTAEEKAFVAYFNQWIDRLSEHYDKVYLVRNEREFHLYSFDDGLRFEPDYVLFLQKNASKGYEQLQVFIEPKGEHLIEKDEWKEKFLLQLKEQAVPVKIFADDNRYRIWGFHFYNHSEETSFAEDMAELVE